MKEGLLFVTGVTASALGGSSVVWKKEGVQMLSSRECTKQLKVFSKVRHYKQLLHAKQPVQGRLTALIVAVRADVEVVIQLAARVVTVCIGQSV